MYLYSLLIRFVFHTGAKLDKKKSKSQWEGRDDGVLEQLVLKRVSFIKHFVN